MEPQIYKGTEPVDVRTEKDLVFCEKFFNESSYKIEDILSLIKNSIERHNNKELDLLILLIEHFKITGLFDLVIAPLLVETWHNLHDKIVLILEKDTNPMTIKYLYLGSTFTC